MKKPKILIIASFPPPLHGSALMSQNIKESLLVNDRFCCDYINLSTSRKMEEIGNNNPLKMLRILGALIFELWKLLSTKYDACYIALTCHGKGFLKDVPFALLCKLFGKKLVIHQHNKGMSKDVNNWPYRWLLPKVYKDAHVVLLSWKLYSDIQMIVPKNKISVCPNGIPYDDIVFTKKDNKVPQLLFLSNLILSKGIIDLLDALKILKMRCRSFHCCIVGDESKDISKEQLNKEISGRDLDDVVLYAGRKTGKEKELIFQKSDIFVHPTTDDCFPLVLLEAMQYRLPIITTDEGGIMDIVKDGENGLICEKRNPLSLANTIERLLKDGDNRRIMGDKGYNKFMSEFTIDVFESTFVDILDRVIN